MSDDPTTPTRKRTFQWQDPAITRQGLSGTGLEFLTRLMNGELPAAPIAETLEFHLVELKPGFSAFEFTPAEYHYNPMGGVHGGIYGVLLDSAMGCAVHTTLGEGIGYTTLEYKINMTRPITIEAGTMRIEGTSVHSGKRLATAEGRIIDASGRVYGHGSTTCMVFPNWTARAPGGD